MFCLLTVRLVTREEINSIITTKEINIGYSLFNTWPFEFKIFEFEFKTPTLNVSRSVVFRFNKRGQMIHFV